MQQAPVLGGLRIEVPFISMKAAHWTALQLVLFLQVVQMFI